MTTLFKLMELCTILGAGIKIVSNQVCFSLLDGRPLNEMTAFCEEAGIKLLCYGAVAGGFLTDRYYQKPKPSEDEITTWSQMKYVWGLSVARLPRTVLRV